jgi:hypothetical protein
VPALVIMQANYGQRRRPIVIDSDLVRAAATGLLLAAWVGGVGMALHATVLHGSVFGLDSHAYWVAGRTAHPYGAAPGAEDAFLYSPIFAQAMRPLSLLPWPMFGWLWLALEAVAVVWITRPMATRWRIPVLLLCIPEVQAGNIHGLLAVTLVLGLSHPAYGGFALLTKITPAAPPLAWFAARGEWRKLVTLATVTLTLVAVSFALSPDLWVEWGRFLITHRDESYRWLIWRFVAAIALTLVGARRNWVWLLPVAVSLALPMDGLTLHGLVILTAIPRLLAVFRLDSSVGKSTSGLLGRWNAMPPRWGAAPNRS